MATKMLSASRMRAGRVARRESRAKDLMAAVAAARCVKSKKDETEASASARHARTELEGKLLASRFFGSLSLPLLTHLQDSPRGSARWGMRCCDDGVTASGRILLISHPVVVHVPG